MVEGLNIFLPLSCAKYKANRNKKGLEPNKSVRHYYNKKLHILWNSFLE